MTLVTRLQSGPRLSFVLIGEGLALAGVIENIRDRGHRLLGVFYTSSDEALASTREIYPVAGPETELAAFVGPLVFDVLMSINNGIILGKCILARPNLAAVNYHNALLPAYAGLRASAWAVLNREPVHGVTWHHIASGIDTGNILAQRSLLLAPDETTASLNERCTAAALESVNEVIDALELRKLSGIAQNTTNRSYFRRSDTVPAGGLIDWKWPSDHILHLVRACEWGQTPNDFGSALVFLGPGQSRFVLSGKAVARSGNVHGEVLENVENRLTVACADAAVCLLLDQPFPLAVGSIIPTPTEEERDHLGGTHRRTILFEHRMLPLFRRLADSSALSPALLMPESLTVQRGDLDKFVAAVGKVLGEDAVIALQAEANLGNLLESWIPITARDGLSNEQVGILSDLGRRRPEFVALRGWQDRVAARIYVRREMGLMPEGSLAYAPDGRVYYAQARALAESIVAVMEEATEKERTKRVHNSRTILDRLGPMATDRPGASAIEAGSETTKRGDLWSASEYVACALLQLGLAVDDGVGVFMPPGKEFVIAALGAMRAGGAYVPLDPASPAERHATEIAEAGVTHIVTFDRMRDTVAFLGLPTLSYEGIVKRCLKTHRLPTIREDGCAYRIFTSGSTGRPKAVEITHRALANLVDHYLHAIPFCAADRMTMLAYTTFDASVADLWPILAAGGTLLIPPLGLLRQLQELQCWLVEAGATCAFVPTAVAERLLKLSWPPQVALRTLLTGGDALHKRPPQGLPFRLINTYGPTENTVDSLWSTVGPGLGTPMIGRPITGVTATVVDSQRRRLPAGTIGELVLGGVQVARGYRRQPKMTKERFGDLTDDQASLHYFTGDRVRITLTGEFEFHGRIDDQVQLRGVRIEPGEIESLLKTDSRVDLAVCMPEYNREEVTGLIAYVVPAHVGASEQNEKDLEQTLLALLSRHLPASVLPSRLYLRSELPHTLAGKLDRKTLALDLSRQHFLPHEPNTETLEFLWRRILPGAGKFSDHESFWCLGGDSLAAIDLLLETERMTGVRISVARFLTEPTLAGVRRLSAAKPTSPIVVLREGTDEPVILWYTLSGDLDAYRHLINQLGNHRILGVISPAIGDPTQLPCTIEDAVGASLRALKDFGITGPVSLCGFSWGGLLAFEAARQLTCAGTPPRYLGLIGTAPPILPRSRAARLGHLLRWGPKSLWKAIREGRPVADQSLASSFRRAIRLICAHGQLPDDSAWETAVHREHVKIGFRYRPVGSIPAKLYLYRDIEKRHHIDHLGYIRYDMPDLGWSSWGVVQSAVRWTNGNHDDLMKENSVTKLGELIQRDLTQTSMAESNQPVQANLTERHYAAENEYGEISAG